jgi:hypothetical protein
MWQMILSQKSIKNHIYHYTTQCEMVIYDGVGVTGEQILHH